MTDKHPRDIAEELLHRTCDHLFETVFGGGEYGNENDICACLIRVFCQRAAMSGDFDPQTAVADYWPRGVPWRGVLGATPPDAPIPSPDEWAAAWHKTELARTHAGHEFWLEPDPKRTARESPAKPDLTLIKLPDDDTRRIVIPPGWQHEPRDLQHAFERLEDTLMLLGDAFEKRDCILRDLEEIWGFHFGAIDDNDIDELGALLPAVQRRLDGAPDDDEPPAEPRNQPQPSGSDPKTRAEQLRAQFLGKRDG